MYNKILVLSYLIYILSFHNGKYLFLKYFVVRHGDSIIVRYKHVLLPYGDICVNTVNVSIHSCVYVEFTELRGCMLFEHELGLFSLMLSAFCVIKKSKYDFT
jgi:hypothetical protein